ncbi:MAG: hypothetical protein H8E48_04880 [Chloroflexi bacterium]|nr:hypothetical protein [Chloroflexota bacterium]
MGPVGHTVISTAIGASVWGVTGSPVAGGAALAVGVLIDADHLIDLYQSWIKGKPDQVLVLAHGWEYSIIGLLFLGLIFYQPIVLGAVLGHLGHVATDHFHYRLTPLSYFITYRIWVGFDAARIAPGRNPAHYHHNLPSFFPFSRLWEPWYRRSVEPWIDARSQSPKDEWVSPSE